jgi:NADH-quinone oxidoreductase subunit C
MTNEALQEKLLQLQPALLIEQGNEWLQVTVEPAQWRELALQLRNDATLQFDYLFCLTCVDWKTHLGMVYHFTSTSLQHTLVVKSTVDRENPEIETVSDIWRTAEFHEREVYDLFGVKFLHHPDLRRLLLTDDFNGFPLRKDFEDPINMIKL